MFLGFCKRYPYVLTFGVSLLVLHNTSYADIAVRFVDSSASSGGNGQSWSTAHKFLQEALSDAPGILAQLPGGSTLELWVADGTYRPDEDDGNTGGSGDRSASFELHNHVNVMGGFHRNISGANGETLKSQRNPLIYTSTLSGDLAIDDSGFTNNSENSYHVVKAPIISTVHIEASAILDGFWIVHGNANGSSTGLANHGGGLLNDEGSPTVSRCTFNLNYGTNGGGMAMRSLQIQACHLYNCLMYGNDSVKGGALYGKDDEALNGGLAGGVTFMNCLIRDNTASSSGGAIYNEVGSGVNLNNCTVTENSSAGVDGIASENPSNALLGTINVNNSIIWNNNTTTFADQITGKKCILFSCVNNVAGQTNACVDGSDTQSDPDFVNAGSNDFSLDAGSPCIDTGVNYSADTDTADVNQDGNTGEATPDLDLNLRIFGGAGTDPCNVDMGAYEQGSTGCSGDVNQDGKVNTADLLAVINAWGACPSPPAACPADIACGNSVNTGDLLLVINNWGCTPLNDFHAAYSPGSLTSVQDCMDAASEEYTPYSEDWDNFVSKCVDGLCEAHIIDCD